MNELEQILLNRVKLIEDDSWSLLGSPNSLIKELQAHTDKAVKEARIDELKGFKEQYDGYYLIHTRNGGSVSRRIKELQEGKE